MMNIISKSTRNGKMKGINLIVCLLAMVYGHVTGAPVQHFPENNSEVQQWIKDNFGKGKLPPFSFVFGNKNSNTFIKDWEFGEIKSEKAQPDYEKFVYSYSDRNSGLVVKSFITCYKDFPAVEWMLTFSNTSGKNTPLIEKVAVVDHSFSSEPKNGFTINHSRGSNAERSDFQPIDEKMQMGKSIYMTPAGGRSSDNTAFPFFNIEVTGQQGMMVAVGWTGKWYANIRQTDEKSVTLTSGMENMKLTLYPGEEIRTPEISLLFWKGEDRMTGHNLFRKFILAHHSRMVRGHFAEYPLSGSFDYGDPSPCNEYNCLTADYAVALVKRYKQFKILPEVFWLDAGWYEGCGWDKGDWYQNVGNWIADRERFPDGLKPISDAVHSVGSKFMVWFEPERVRSGTIIDREHPGWLINIPGNENRLFNLGDKNARIWLTDYITDFLKKQGIDYYRQDFNFDPMPYWIRNDKPDRTGISEIRHIEGLYAFWDSLLVRFPDLLIDNCASGGRRLDLESISRSAPLWRTDYQYGEPNGYQCHTFGLHFYLPIHGTAIYKTDSYTFRSGLGSAAVFNWEVTGRNSESIPAMQKSITDYQLLRPYFYADYYPLTESRNNTGNNVWLAYQFNRSEQKDGIILAFRREGSMQDSIRVKLHGLREQAIYNFSFEDYGLVIKKTGKELMDGIDISIPQKPASLLIRYKEQ
jgi:alpha-galactosidase